jgi:hypothetical protein
MRAYSAYILKDVFMRVTPPGDLKTVHKPATTATLRPGTQEQCRFNKYVLDHCSTMLSLDIMVMAF